MRRKRPGSVAASLVVVVAGAGVALVPTLYTVYPEWTMIHHERRLIAVLVWLVCVAVVGIAAARRDLFVETVARAVSQVGRKVADRREEAYYSIIETMLEPGAHGLSSGFAFRLFRPVRRDGTIYLMPLNEPDHEPWERWEIGHGAVGIVWEEVDDDVYLFLDGEKLDDHRLGLSDQQRTAYGDLTFVAACAMHDETRIPVAVLAVSSAQPAASETFLLENGPWIHRKLADDLGVLLADLFLPEPSGPHV